jgi:hypothetical protein
MEARARRRENRVRLRTSSAADGGSLVVGWVRRRGPAITSPREVLDTSGGERMATNRPDPGEFLELAQRMLRELFGDQRSHDEPWAEATRRSPGRSEIPQGNREPSAEQQRENLTFALATRAVEALEDLALNVAAIRQRLERTDTHTSAARPENEERGPGGADAAGE